LGKNSENQASLANADSEKPHSARYATNGIHRRKFMYLEVKLDRDFLGKLQMEFRK